MTVLAYEVEDRLLDELLSTETVHSSCHNSPKEIRVTIRKEE